MENNGYIYESEPVVQAEAAPSAPDYKMPEAEKQPEKKPELKSYMFSLPARVGMWIVGVIAGLTIIFGCGIVWMLGLDYLGVIDRADKQEKNGTYNFYIYGENEAVPQTPNAGGSYDDFENFLDDFFNNGGDDFSEFFGDFYGNGGANIPDNNGGANAPENNGGAEAQPQAGTPGLGITVVELTLDFAIEDKYTAGLVIDTIEDYSSFVGTEVKENDMIVAAEGKAVTNVAELKACYAGRSIGDEVGLTIARYSNGVATTFDVTVKLIEMR